MNDYTDINDDGEIEIVNSLMETRSKLLLNDLKGAKMTLTKINSPFPYELEVILQKINELLIFNENIYEGGLINSSRAILFPETSKRYNKIYDWRETIIMALNKAKKELINN